MLNGKKTYIVATIAVLLNALVIFEVITINQLAEINSTLAFLGLAALRDGVKSSN